MAISAKTAKQLTATGIKTLQRKTFASVDSSIKYAASNGSNSTTLWITNTLVANIVSSYKKRGFTVTKLKRPKAYNNTQVVFTW